MRQTSWRSPWMRRPPAPTARGDSAASGEVPARADHGRQPRLRGEYMNEQLLLRLPHRQFVFTLPKVLRVFFRHDTRLHGEISRLVYGLVRDLTTAASDISRRTAAVVVYLSSGQFARRCSGPPWGWNPHWHGLFLEGGFDQEGRFLHLPTVDLANMSGCFRQRVIAFFLERKLLNERLARNMVKWTHSGFSVNNIVMFVWAIVKRSV